MHSVRLFITILLVLHVDLSSCQDTGEEGGVGTFQLGEKKTGDYELCQNIAKEIRKKGTELYHTPGPTPANWSEHLRQDYELRVDKPILVGWKSIPGESSMSCSPAQEQCSPMSPMLQS